METEYKGESGGEKFETPVANKSKMRGWDVVLRFLAVALCLSAAVVLAVDKQTTTAAIPLLPTLPPITVPVTAKAHYLSAFVFFIAANAIACAHAAISLVVTLANRGDNKGIAVMILLSDVVMVALLFSSLGAAAAIGVMGYKGNTHVQWKKVCNITDKFCHQAAGALALSGAACILFLLLVVLATLNLHKKRC